MLPLGETACPRTTRPEIAELPTSPVAPAGPAAAPARTVIDWATISPPSAETASVRTFASAEDEVPGCAVTLVVEAPTRRIDPSAGCANAPLAVAVGGAETRRGCAARLTGNADLRDERGCGCLAWVGIAGSGGRDTRGGSSDQDDQDGARCSHDTSGYRRPWRSP